MPPRIGCRAAARPAPAMPRPAAGRPRLPAGGRGPRRTPPTRSPPAMAGAACSAHEPPDVRNARAPPTGLRAGSRPRGTTPRRSTPARQRIDRATSQIAEAFARAAPSFDAAPPIAAMKSSLWTSRTSAARRSALREWRSSRAVQSGLSSTKNGLSVSSSPSGLMGRSALNPSKIGQSASALRRRPRRWPSSRRRGGRPWPTAAQRAFRGVEILGIAGEAGGGQVAFGGLLELVVLERPVAPDVVLHLGGAARRRSGP